MPTTQTLAAAQKQLPGRGKKETPEQTHQVISLTVGGRPGNPKSDGLPEHLTIGLLWNGSLIALRLEVFRFEQKSLFCMCHESSHKATVSCSYFLWWHKLSTLNLGTLGVQHFLGCRKVGVQTLIWILKKVSTAAGFSITHGSVLTSALYAIWGHREGGEGKEESMHIFLKMQTFFRRENCLPPMVVWQIVSTINSSQRVNNQCSFKSMIYDHQNYSLYLFVLPVSGVGLTVFCKIWCPQICFWKWVSTKFSCLLASVANGT